METEEILAPFERSGGVISPSHEAWAGRVVASLVAQRKLSPEGVKRSSPGAVAVGGVVGVNP